jgi:hypothetical protein
VTHAVTVADTRVRARKVIVTSTAVMIPRREADDIVSLNVKGPGLGLDLRASNLVADHTTALRKTALEEKRIAKEPLYAIVGAEVGRRRLTGSVTPPKSSSSKVKLSDVTN